MYDAVALGEILIDFTSQAAEHGIPMYAQNPGGAPLNLLAQMALLGKRVSFFGKVGADGFGSFLRQVMDARGIDTSSLSVSHSAHTTLAFVHLDSSGERTFTFYRQPGADIMLEPGDIDTEKLCNTKLFHVGSLSMTDEPARSATLFALETARRAGCMISYDPNYRQPLWTDQTQAVRTMKGLLPYADILKVSGEEMILLTGTDDLEKGSALLMDAGPALVFVTLGAGGAFYRCPGGCGAVPGYHAAVVDTNGAGDSFFGAALSRLGDHTRQTLPAIPPEDIAEIVRFANAAGCLTATRYGALTALPTAEELYRFMDQ